MTPESAPQPGCECAVCQWANRLLARDQDLADNYRRYEAGELVSKDEKD